MFEEGLVLLEPEDGGGYFRQQVGSKLTKTAKSAGAWMFASINDVEPLPRWG
ncbi:MAG: hypothetical protein H0V83_13940 [Rubrobacter sp.]|nr:hypothetical protein [Rubrobacter sp.]